MPAHAVRFKLYSSNGSDLAPRTESPWGIPATEAYTLRLSFTRKPDFVVIHRLARLGLKEFCSCSPIAQLLIRPDRLSFMICAAMPGDGD
jgi:hypothetical protein